MPDDLRLIVLADDPLARAGLAALLGSLPGLIVAAQGSASGWADFFEDADQIGADVVVWDFGWSPADDTGNVADEEIPDSIPILALVQDTDQATEAWSLGATGIIFRNVGPERLALAVRAVAEGLRVLEPVLTHDLLSQNRMEAGAESADLTPREAEVLSLVAEGLTNKAIAQRLAISEHTVKFHVNALLTKLNAQSRTDAVVKATRLGHLSL